MQSNHITIVVLALLTLGITLAVSMNREAPVISAEKPVSIYPMADPAEPIEQPTILHPAIEVVFALDTTGSMGGLISGAKQKIWAIINDLKQGQPEPHLKIGLVAYRDRGDAYVTRLSPLSDDIDSVYGDLMGFQAAGGGDTPESVNQALYEAVTRFQWSDNPDTLRVVFLVGDAPPQMGYQDDVKFTETCRIAQQKDIIINTIQCGDYQETAGIWKHIAHLSSGGYAAIRQNGGMVIASTPMDDRIDRLNREINETIIPYGDREERDMARAKQSMAGSIVGFAAAERSTYLSASEPAAAITGREDLVAEVANARVDLEKLDTDKLPEEMREMEAAAQVAYVEDRIAQRQRLQAELGEELKKRESYLKEKASKDNVPADAFDVQVRDMLYEQAASKAIRFETAEDPGTATEGEE